MEHQKIGPIVVTRWRPLRGGPLAGLSCRGRVSLVGLLGTLLAAVSGAHAQEPHLHAMTSRTPAVSAPAASLVLDHVTVIDVEHGARWRDQRVLVVGNRIRALGSPRTVRVPPGARLVDARGKYLIPGLWDMHIHPFIEADSIYHKAQAVYLQLIANGVTGIRDAGSSVPLDTFRVWKREIATERRIGPRMLVSGPAIDDAIEVNDHGRVIRCTRLNRTAAACHTAPQHTYVDDPEDARHLVDSLKAAGADMIKMYNLSLPTYFAIAAEARRIGIPFGGHVPPHEPNERGLDVSDSGAVFLDHQSWMSTTRGCGESISLVPGELLSTLRCAALAAARLRQHNTWLTPLGIGVKGRNDSAAAAFRQRALRYAGPAGYPKATWRPLSAAERRQWPTSAAWAVAYGIDSATVRQPGCQLALLEYLVDLPVVVGPDFPLSAPPGANIHLSLLNRQLCGVPPLWALQTATLNPVRALRLTDSLGTVVVGKVADLVLLEGDPLEDLWNVSRIAGVVANGRYCDRAALDRLLVEAKAAWRKNTEQRAKEQRPEIWPDVP